MPRSATEIDKDLNDFKQRISDEHGQLKGRLETLKEADVFDASIDRAALERLESQFHTLRDALTKGLEKLDKELRERMDDKTKTVKDTLETKYDGLKDKVNELTTEMRQRKTWGLPSWRLLFPCWESSSRWS